MLTDNGILLFVSTLLCLFSFYRIQQIRNAWRAFGNLSTYSVIISPISLLYIVTPRISWITGGDDFAWRNSYESQGFLEYCFLHDS